jgi:hypothetical protein
MNWRIIIMPHKLSESIKDIASEICDVELKKWIKTHGKHPSELSKDQSEKDLATWEQERPKK